MKNIFISLASFLWLIGSLFGAKNSPLSTEKVEQWIKAQPVRFLENKGQMVDMQGKPVPFVLYKAESPGMNIYITEKGITYLFVKSEEEKRGQEENSLDGTRESSESKTMNWVRVDMELAGASIRKENSISENPSMADFNFFYGHCPNGIYGVKEYEKITFTDVYPGIDWVFYNSTDKGFKYDFIVHPGANPDQIKLLYHSKENIQLDDEGNIQIKTSIGTLTEYAPVSYLKESQASVSSNFHARIIDKHTTEVSFSFLSFSTTETLVIDPQLQWGTYYGGNGSEGFCSVITDASGNFFISGYTGSPNFPTQNPGGATHFDGTFSGTSDAIILKFSNCGVLLWATYYGGSRDEHASSIAIDASGNIFITGSSTSFDFPTHNPGGGAYYQPANGGTSWYDVIILKFSNSGVRLWATYYGGGWYDRGSSIAVDIFGNIFITGFSDHASFTPVPTLNPGGGAYFQSSSAGGDDIIIMKFSNSGVLLWGTYYGSNGGSLGDRGHSITTDIFGNVFITGLTDSPGFPVLNPGGGAYIELFLGPSARAACIIKFNNNGVLLWSTLYDGWGGSEGYGIATDASGNVFVTGLTASSSFPVLDPGGGAYFQPNYAGGGRGDVFILKFNNNGVRIWATYYGGNRGDLINVCNYGLIGRDRPLVIDASGSVYITGLTGSANFPIYDPGGGVYFQGTHAGGVLLHDSLDVFFLKFNNAGVREWATFNGTSSSEFGASLAIDPSGCLIAVGEWWGTGSNGLMNPGGNSYYDGSWNGDDDSYIMKFCQPNPPLVSISGINKVCYGQCTGTATAIPNSCSSSYTYLWSNGATTSTITGLCAGTYTVIITDASSATSTATVSIAALSASAMNITPASMNALCNGQCTGTATVTVTGGTPGYTYSWFPGGSTSPVVSNLCAGTHTVIITDVNVCTTTQTISIAEPPAMTFSITSAPASCNQNNGMATISPSGGMPGYMYNWAPSGGTNATATGLAGGIYTVNVTDTNGCKQTAIVNVNSNPGPTALINPSSSITIITGTTTTITASGGGMYSWSNGQTDSSITVVPTTATIYCVVITDTNNCRDTACITVFVKIDCPESDVFYVPNAFSPNMDTENDELQLFYKNFLCIKALHIRIYDRWGELVFESTDSKFKWDGSYEGKTQSPAVFTYYMEVILINEQQIFKKGNISLIR